MKYKNEFKYLIRLCCSMYICSLVYRFYILANFRSSRPEVVYQKGVLRNFTKFLGKHQRQRPATLLKKRLWHRCFPMNFVKFLRTPFFHRTPLVAASQIFIKLD